MINFPEFANSVNKFFYYIHNFESCPITYPTFSGDKTEIIPAFFAIFPPYLIQHMLMKFRAFCEDNNTAQAIVSLYAELDKEYRVKFLEFVNANYKDHDLV